jgi:hypothetical protein
VESKTGQTSMKIIAKSHCISDKDKLALLNDRQIICLALCNYFTLRNATIIAAC